MTTDSSSPVAQNVRIITGQKGYASNGGTCSPTVLCQPHTELAPMALVGYRAYVCPSAAAGGGVGGRFGGIRMVFAACGYSGPGRLSQAKSAADRRATVGGFWLRSALLVTAGALALTGCTATHGARTTSKPDSSARSGGPPVAASSVPSDAATGSVRPVPGKTIQPPSPGNVTDTVSPLPVKTLRVAPLTGAANFGGGVVGTISSVDAINVTTKLPGEVGGAAIKVTVEIKNDSKRAISLDAVVVNAQDSTAAPAIQVTTPPAEKFYGQLHPGHTATGVYVFTVDKAKRSPVTVSVTYSAAAPVARFKGDVK